MAYLNYLAFPLSADRVTFYTTGNNAVFSKIFDTTNNLMVLPIMPGSYTPTIRSLSATDVVEGSRSTVVRTSETRQGATVEIANGMAVVGAVLNELRQNAIADESYRITVYDGCMVEFKDRTQGHTVRQWWLEQPVIPKSSQVRLTIGHTVDERAYAGYTLEFIEFGG